MRKRRHWPFLSLAWLLLSMLVIQLLLVCIVIHQIKQLLISGVTDNIHPRNKQTLGYRTSLLAETMLYGAKDVVDSGNLAPLSILSHTFFSLTRDSNIFIGPIAREMTVLANGPDAVVRIFFRATDVGVREPILRPALCPQAFMSQCGWFDITTA